MDKILLTMEVPSVEQKFDVLVPSFTTVEELRPLVYQLLEELTVGAYTSSGDELICRREDGSVFPTDVSFERLGIKMGDHLILF